MDVNVFESSTNSSIYLTASYHRWYVIHGRDFFLVCRPVFFELKPENIFTFFKAPKSAFPQILSPKYFSSVRTTLCTDDLTRNPDLVSLHLILFFFKNCKNIWKTKKPKKRIVTWYPLEFYKEATNVWTTFSTLAPDSSSHQTSRNISVLPVFCLYCLSLLCSIIMLMLELLLHKTFNVTYLMQKLACRFNLQRG